MSTLRPLPSRPSLEHARKEAKALLRRIRAGDRDALARARELHPQIDTPGRPIRLADAQLVGARAFGFASWPRLVRYLDDSQRQRDGYLPLHGSRADFEVRAEALRAGHAARRASAGRALAAYVPRFYGLPLDDIFAHTVTEDEARLAVARTHGAPSWEVLAERLEASARSEPRDWATDPILPAAEAMKAADLVALRRVVAAHPELLRPSESDVATGRTLMSLAAGRESALGTDALRPIVEWLGERGFDRQGELNRRLRGGMRMKPEQVRDLLDRGADAGWVPPNGIPLLEHALLCYWNGAAVDVLAARATPRRALWIAAGLGDVDGVHGFLDARGRPTAAARRLRPDFVAVGQPGGLVPLPDADDEELLLEALLVAILNQRTRVIEYLASRGAPLNGLVYETPLVSLAVGNSMAQVAECLVRCGADLDLRGRHPDVTARQLARELFEQMPLDADRRRIVEICGMDPDALRTERDARPAPAPFMIPLLRRALALAARDAAGRGQRDVRPENVVVGLLWLGSAVPPLRRWEGFDPGRLRADLLERVDPTSATAPPPDLPMRADARAALASAVPLATERRSPEVNGSHLLHALLHLEDDGIRRLLARLGLSGATLLGELAESM